MTHSTMWEALSEMCFKPNLILTTGKPGYGKTHLCQVLCAWVLLNGGHVLSNSKLQKWDNAQSRPFEAAYPNYHFGGTLVEYLVQISEIVRADRKAHIFLFLDEGQNALDSLSFAGKLSKTFKLFLSLMRKFRTTICIATPRGSFLLKAIRDEKEGLVSVQLLKDPLDVEEWGQDLLDEGYEHKEIVVVDWPGEGIDHAPAHVGIASILAMPEEVAKETGAVYFDTGGIASLSYGVHPVTGDNVDFVQLLAGLNDFISYDYPEYLYRFFHEAPKVPEVRASEVLSSGPLMVAPVQGVANSAPKGIKAGIIKALKDGMPILEIMQKYDCSRGLVQRYKKEFESAPR